MIWIALGLLVGALALIAPATAQNNTGLVVSICGSPATAFKAGNPGPYTVDTTGTLCTPGSAPTGGSFPRAATPIQGNATGSTAAVVGSLAAAAGKTTYICDFDVSAIGGTAAVGPIVIAGLLGGSKTYQLSSSAAGVALSKSFSPCLPASATNTAITITTTADGTATAVDVNSSGYQQ